MNCFWLQLLLLSSAAGLQHVLCLLPPAIKINFILLADNMTAPDVAPLLMQDMGFSLFD